MDGFNSGPRSLPPKVGGGSTFKTGMEGPSTGGSGSIATGIVGGLTDLVGLGVDIWSTYETMKQAEQNYDLQKKILKYNKDIQKQMFEREDNAVLRRKLDLQRAGLSPTLAAGSSAGAGPVVGVNTPQKNVNYTMPKMNIQQKVLDMIQMKASVDRTFAENDYIKMQTEKANAEKNLTNTKNAKEARELRINQETGLSGDKSSIGKIANDIYNWWTGGTKVEAIKSDIKSNSELKHGHRGRRH